MSSSTLTNAEKENLKSVTTAMLEKEKKYCLMFYPTEMLQNELARRDESINNTLGELCSKLSMVEEGMTLNEKEAVVNGVISTISEASCNL